MDKPAHIRVAGMDPSFNNWGLALGSYNLKTDVLTLDSLHLIKPATQLDKRILVSAKDLEKATDLYSQLQPFLPGLSACFVEVPSGSQSSRAALCNGVCYGVLGALQHHGLPIYQFTEQALKVATLGTKSAAKQITIDWAMKTYPSEHWPTQKVKGKTRIVATKANHMADAVAAMHVGVRSPSFNQHLKLLNAA